MKVRIYALVKELSSEGIKITNKGMVDKLKAMGVSVSSHSSSIDEEIVKEVRKSLSNSGDSKVSPSERPKDRGQSKVSPKAKPSAISPQEAPNPSNKETKAKVRPKTTAKEGTKPRWSKVSVKAKSSPQSSGRPSSGKPAGTPARTPSFPRKGTKTETRPEPAAENKKPASKFDKKSKSKTPVFKRFQIKKPGQKTDNRQSFKRDDRRGNRPRSAPQSGFKAKPLKKEVVEAQPKALKILRPFTVGSLAFDMKVDGGMVIKKLMELDVLATINQEIEAEAASLVASEFGYDLTVSSWEEELDSKEEATDPSKLKPRAPVVTIMGHVDHGKTSLLDVVRQTNVVDNERGGITQHIGAYQVETKGGPIVFLDTPGHEAFTSMRARGAKVTDVVVLVVAADDGVMPQTVEAIDHARAAEVPIIVAVNKIDVDGANPERVRQDLANYDLLPEDWGGKTIVVDVSAKEKQGIESLLDMILLQAEVLELVASPDRQASGTIIEARVDRGRGAVATVLVQDGTLRVGSSFVTSASYGKVRAMISERGDKIIESPPSTPVEVLGFSELPQAGDKFYTVMNEREARSIFTSRQEALRRTTLSPNSGVTLDDLHSRIQEGDITELKLIIKGDVDGSVEAIADALSKLDGGEIKLRTIHKGVGGITEMDVMLASVSNAIILGFGIRPDIRARELAENQHVDIQTYDVIYNVVSDIEAAMKGLRKPKYREIQIGRAEVREVFKISKLGTIAGCFITDGKIERSSRVRLLRDSRPVYDGDILSLRRFKDDAREVQTGLECGIGIENFNDIKVDDVIEAYAMEEVRD